MTMFYYLIRRGIELGTIITTYCENVLDMVDIGVLNFKIQRDCSI